MNEGKVEKAKPQSVKKVLTKKAKSVADKKSQPQKKPGERLLAGRADYVDLLMGLKTKKSLVLKH